MPAFCGAAEQGFEVPPDQPAHTLLPPALIAGENFAVVEPVRSDGLMYPFRVDRRFGTFDVLRA